MHPLLLFFLLTVHNSNIMYDKYALLIKNQGRSCQDEYYIEEI